MRRFRFRLERLARLADQREELARRDLGVAAGRVHALQDRLAQLDADRRAALEPTVPVRLGAALADAAGSRARVAQGELARAESERELRRAVWGERRAAAAAFERLRERRRAVWQRERRAAERDAVDATVASAALRRNWR